MSSRFTSEDVSPTVLFLTELTALGQHMDRCVYNWHAALAALSNFVVVDTADRRFRHGMPLREAVEVFSPRRAPDLILHGVDRRLGAEPLVAGLAECPVPSILELHDTWGKFDVQSEFIRANRFTLAFMPYANYIESYADACPDTTFFWWPNAVDTQLFRDYGQDKTCDVLVYGRLDRDYYPFRTRLAKLLARQIDLKTKVLQHPGYWEVGEPVLSAPVTGADLSRELNRSWLTISTCGTQQGLFFKYFEIAASGSVAAGNLPQYGNVLFGDIVVPLAPEDADEVILTKLRDALSDKGALRQMAAVGQDRVIQRHSTVHSAGAFNTILREVLVRWALGKRRRHLLPEQSQRGTPLCPAVSCSHPIRLEYAQSRETVTASQASMTTSSEVRDAVDFVIKSFLRPQALLTLLTSIRRYYPAVDITIADDGELAHRVDPASRACRDWLSADQHSRLITLPFGSGLSSGRNTLVASTTREFVLVLDDDFRFCESTRIETMLKAMRANPSLGVVGGACLTHLPEGSRRTPFVGWLEIVNGDIRHEFLKQDEYSCGMCDITLNFMLVRRDVFRGIHWEGGMGAEHYDFFLQLKQTPWKVRYCDEVVVEHEPLAPALDGYRERRQDVVTPLNWLLCKWKAWRLIENGRIVFGASDESLSGARATSSPAVEGAMVSTSMSRLASSLDGLTYLYTCDSAGPKHLEFEWADRVIAVESKGLTLPASPELPDQVFVVHAPDEDRSRTLNEALELVRTEWFCWSPLRTAIDPALGWTMRQLLDRKESMDVSAYALEVHDCGWHWRDNREARVRDELCLVRRDVKSRFAGWTAESLVLDPEEPRRTIRHSGQLLVRPLGLDEHRQRREAARRTLRFLEYERLCGSANAYWWFRLGRAQQWLCRFDEAATSLSCCVTLAPDEAPFLAEAHARLARCLLQLGRWEPVRECLRKAIQLFPADPNLSVAAGDLQAAVGEVTAAERYWRLAIEQMQSHERICTRVGRLREVGRLRSILAEAFVGRQEWQLVEEQARLLLGDDGESAAGWELLSDSFLARHRISDADEAARYLLSRPSLKSLGRAVLARIALAVGNQEGARRTIQDAIREGDEHLATLRAWAEFAIRETHTTSAEEALLRLATLEPSQAAVHHNLGTLYVNAKRWGAAAQSFVAAVRCEPLSAASWAQLGFSQWQLGQCPEALEALERAAALAPTDETIRKYLDECRDTPSDQAD